MRFEKFVKSLEKTIENYINENYLKRETKITDAEYEQLSSLLDTIAKIMRS